MRRRLVGILAGVMAAMALAPVANAAESETCRRFGAEWQVCVWLLEPNPSGGNLFHVVVCEGATCVYLEEPSRS